MRLSGEAVHAARLVSGKRSNAAGFTEIWEGKSMKISEGIKKNTGHKITKCRPPSGLEAAELQNYISNVYLCF